MENKTTENSIKRTKIFICSGEASNTFKGTFKPFNDGECWCHYDRNRHEFIMKRVDETTNLVKCIPTSIILAYSALHGDQPKDEISIPIKWLEDIGVRYAYKID